MGADSISVAKPSEILNALKGRIEPPALSGAYKLGLLVVTAAMVLLPAAYLGLIGLAAWGTYYHSVHNVSWLAGSAIKLRFFVYLMPIAAGVSMVVFMLKPLFSRAAEQHQTRSLEKKDEPLLFSFVERLCRVVGAPVPDQIDVDTMINASAGHLGMVSLKGSKLVLTIGLPLAAGLTLREFAGVLAHEFGHFSQAAGMRLSQLIRRVNYWFSRVVEERDEWDDWLIQTSEDSNAGAGALLAWVARFFVWLSRRVLHALMMLGHMISCYLMRQMEFDADRYGARVAGSEAFAATALRVRVLVAANQLAYQQLWESWMERRLAEDLPALIVAKAESLPPEMLRQLQHLASQEQTHLFDTHPSDRERIERARTEGRMGLIRMDVAATTLFRDFAGLCRSVTLDHYHQLTGQRIGEQNLVHNQELLGHGEARAAADRAKQAFFQGLSPAARPLFLGIDALPGGAPLIEELRDARQRFERAMPAARLGVAQFEKAEPMLLGALLARQLLGAGLAIDAKAFHLPAASLEGVERARARGVQLQQTHEPAIAAAEAALRARFQLALRALRREEIATALAGQVTPEEVDGLVAALRRLEQVHPPLQRLRESLLALQALFANLTGREDDAQMGNMVRTALAEVHAARDAVAEQLGDTLFPFEHAEGEVTIAAYLQAGEEGGGNPQTAAALIERFDVLLDRIWGRLALVAERVEAAAGLAPPPAPARG